jgi:hypothetical protein
VVVTLPAHWHQLEPQPLRNPNHNPNHIINDNRNVNDNRNHDKPLNVSKKRWQQALAAATALGLEPLHFSSH